jgi:F-type H+-transporting ATPase subunit b
VHGFFGEPRTWVAVAFVIFFVLFGNRLWKALAGMLDAHAERVRSELNEASRLRTEAEAMLADANTRRDTAIAEARAMLESARGEAVRLAEQARVDAEAAGRRREQMAMDRIAAAEKAAVTEVRTTAADIAARAAAEVIAQTLSAEGDAPIIDRSIAALPAALARRAA